MKPTNNSCQGSSLTCFQGVFYYLGYYRSVLDPFPAGPAKPCLAACTDFHFSLAVSSSRYPSKESFNHRPAFCRVVAKVSTYLARTLVILRTSL